MPKPKPKPNPARKWKTIKAQVEATPKIAELEAHWFKNPAEELREAMVWRKAEAVMPDYWKRGKMTVHSHPQYRRPSIPSINDLLSLSRIDSRCQSIASITPEGKVAGYTMIAKPKGFAQKMRETIKILDNSPEKKACKTAESRIIEIRKIISELSSLPKSIENEKRIAGLQVEWRERGTAYTDAVKSAMKKINWKIRMVPMKEFEFRWGYYVKRPPAPKPGAVAVRASARDKNKKEEELRRMRLLNERQNLGRLRN
ncbi:MAG: hypothetical protein WC602_00785 [archaeon]